MTINCVAAYLMTYELNVLEVYVYGASNAVLYCMDSTLQQLRGLRCYCTPQVKFAQYQMVIASRLKFSELV